MELFASLEKAIKDGRNSLSADRLDMSFGELMNMYADSELIIDPDFQRLFRWTEYQKTRFIESLLLGIPIPSIFVAENDEGRWEIVDGLQRMSTIFSFFGLLKGDQIINGKEANYWTMCDGDILKELENLTINDLPLKFQLNIKRSVCRIEVIKWDSNYDMRYELFSRLNTGGSPLTEQEIRNCIFRGVSPEFTVLVKELASSEEMKRLIQPTDKQKSELYLDELVLRFLSLYQNYENINKKISDYMTEYMREATKDPSKYDYKVPIFKRTLNIVSTLGKTSFRARNGQFSTSLYDGIMQGLAHNIDKYENSDSDLLPHKIEQIKNDEEFTRVSGPASNNKDRTKKRVNRAIDIFSKPK